MTELPEVSPESRLRAALQYVSSSERLQSALAAGTYPRPGYVEVLIDQCAVERDFLVRDMMTWALTRHPVELTVPRLLDELRSPVAQARSQALHTLSKIGDPRGWTAIGPELLADPNDEVARSAWRAAVILVPEGSESDLATHLVTQLGRGPHDLQSSLTRAISALGAQADAALEPAEEHSDPVVRLHAVATRYTIDHPDEGFDSALFEAERILAFPAELQDDAAGQSSESSPDEKAPEDSSGENPPE